LIHPLQIIVMNRPDLLIAVSLPMLPPIWATKKSNSASIAKLWDLVNATHITTVDMGGPFSGSQSPLGMCNFGNFGGLNGGLCERPPNGQEDAGIVAKVTDYLPIASPMTALRKPKGRAWQMSAPPEAWQRNCTEWAKANSESGAVEGDCDWRNFNLEYALSRWQRSTSLPAKKTMIVLSMSGVLYPNTTSLWTQQHLQSGYISRRQMAACQRVPRQPKQQRVKAYEHPAKTAKSCSAGFPCSRWQCTNSSNCIYPDMRSYPPGMSFQRECGPIYNETQFHAR
jgi:hypothetical protein